MSRTVIGPGTRVAGALEAADDLTVEGIVDGPVRGAAQVVIAPGSTVNGVVRGREVVLAGRLVHDLFGSVSVRLMATAELVGNIEAPRVAIDEGAVFEGQVRMKRSEPAAARPPAPITAQAAPVPEGPREIPSLPAIGKRKLIRRDA